MEHLLIFNFFETASNYPVSAANLNAQGRLSFCEAVFEIVFQKARAKN